MRDILELAHEDPPCEGAGYTGWASGAAVKALESHRSHWAWSYGGSWKHRIQADFAGSTGRLHQQKTHSSD